MYVYADMTDPSMKVGQTAVLVSEIMEVPNKGALCLTFYYHKNGNGNDNSMTLIIPPILLKISY